jgi:hypothetical protein
LSAQSSASDRNSISWAWIGDRPVKPRDDVEFPSAQESRNEEGATSCEITRCLHVAQATSAVASD